MKNYNHNFYKNRNQKTVYSAKTILSTIIDVLPEIKSAVDLGCGVGTWLSVLKEIGLEDIQGFDGPWVEKDLLEIPVENFQAIDLVKPIKLERKFNLAISLEVAEHLPPDAAKMFVDSLVNLSDFILFSAAIPLQGGKNHLNEQWPDYWADIFKEQGYVVLDFIRRRIWNDQNIPTWYRQNILLFVRQERMKDLKIINSDINNQSGPLSIVHPNTYVSKISSVKGSWRQFRKAINRWFMQKINQKNN
jgi:hypothetical protein